MAVALFEDIQIELNRVYECMVQELQSDQSFLNQLTAHLLQARGKMIRPALVILAGKLCNKGNPEKLYSLGAAMEILHMATLVHDDIIDEAQIRRNILTVNTVYGNRLAVLVGDFFYAHALKLVAPTTYGVEIVSQIVSHLVEGEFIQHANCFRLDQRMEEYWKLIHCKTAFFIANCCRLGALAGGGTVKEVQMLTKYGRLLGLGFQICDDLLDVSANAEKLGKPMYQDIANGIYTLPILHALAHSTEQGRLRQILQKDLRTESDYQSLQQCLHHAGSLEFAYAKAAELCQAAQDELSSVPDSPEKTMLLGLTQFNLQREC